MIKITHKVGYEFLLMQRLLFHHLALNIVRVNHHLCSCSNNRHIDQLADVTVMLDG